MFYGSYDTQIRIDDTVAGAAPQPGTLISGEDDLGLQDTQFLGQVELTLFPGTHHLARFNVISMRRDGSVVTTKRIEYDNENFPPGTLLDSYLNLGMLGLTYGYFPWRTDRFELAGTFGIQIGEVSARLQARSTAPREPDSATGPLPVVGIEGRYDFSRRWSVDARFNHVDVTWFESLGADLNAAEGSFTDARISVRWRQGQHVAWGLGYRYFNFEAESTQTDTSGFVSIGVTGPMLFVQASL